MSVIGFALSAIGGIGAIICFIIVLIKMFKTEKPMLGILGIFCALWTFIWGWMKAEALGLKKIMMIWTACIILAVIGNALAGASIASQIESGQFETQQY